MGACAGTGRAGPAGAQDVPFRIRPSGTIPCGRDQPLHPRDIHPPEHRHGPAQRGRWTRRNDDALRAGEPPAGRARARARRPLRPHPRILRVAAGRGALPERDARRRRVGATGWPQSAVLRAGQSDAADVDARLAKRSRQLRWLPVDFACARAGYPSFFLANELAHQWWGQGVGWKNYHEQWISEGFAQYFAALWARKERGDELFFDLLRQMRRWSLEQSSQGPVYLGYRLGHIRA